MQVKQWWFEPITWQQAEAIAKHYNIPKEQAPLIYPTKGSAVAAINASLFKERLQLAVSDVIRGNLTTSAQLRGYFIDDSEGGENILGSRKLKNIWAYLLPLVQLRQQQTRPPKILGGQ